VEIVGLSGHVVCYTTDGTDPAEAHGTCSGATTARLPETSRITLGCGSETSAFSVHGVKLAFDWDGHDGVTAAGNFVLDCTQPEPDRDGDGLPDNRDNCPFTPNPDQVDADHNGIGNVCDPTPRGDPPLPWDNEVLARAVAKWTDEVKCTLNGCKNPSAPGSWSASCDGSGTVVWDVGLNGFRAASTFTYKSCQHTVSVNVHDYVGDPNSTNAGATVPMDITLIVSGSTAQDTDFSGNGNGSGTITVGGSFTGSVTSHMKIVDSANTTGSSLSVACTADPIPEETCAPNNLSVNYVFPDWSCEPGGCPAPPAPLTDRDGDGVFDPYDNCPDVPNPSQANADFDALGDACDPDAPLDAGDHCTQAAKPGQMDAGIGDAGAPTPNGTSAFWVLKVKVGRCLYDSGGAIGSTESCDPTQSNQQWEMIDAGSGKSAFRNRGTMQCLTAASWAGALGMAPCDTVADAGVWLTERYDLGGFDPLFPMRLRSAAQGYCLYTDGTGFVYATQSNCDLSGTQDNRKVGLYPGGDFSMNPVQPP